MKIRYKAIEHERTEDSPFVSALISGISCGNRCKGCHNKELKTQPIIFENEAIDIIKEIVKNPFNQGIVLGGLEWSEQVFEMLELIKIARQYDLSIMIYTGLDLVEFHARIGVACADKFGFDNKVSEKMLVENDNSLFAIMGASVLDYYIDNDYYIKTGKYDKDVLTTENIQFGVMLASANQRIYKIRGKSNDNKDKKN